MNPTYTLEKVVCRCFGYGGLHSRVFRDSIYFDFWDGDDGITYDGCASSIWLEKLTITLTAASIGYAIVTEEITLPVVATFNIHSNYGIFFSGYGGSNYIALRWTPTTVSVCSLSGQTLTEVVTVPYEVNSGSKITVSVMAQRLSSLDLPDWISLAAYEDGALIVSGSYEMTNPGQAASGRLGFACDSNDTTVSYLDVPELHRIIEWSGIDPAESASTGMSRAIGSSSLFIFTRYDGTVSVFRPRGSLIAPTVDVSGHRITSLQDSINYLTPNHMRTVGAWLEGDVFDDSSMELMNLHAFKKLDDPNAWSTDDIERENSWAIYDAKESRRSFAMSIPMTPLLEPEDLISILDTKGMLAEPSGAFTGLFRVHGISISVSRKKGAPVISQEVSCSQYVDEEVDT
jgi:hypothetical protein